MTKPQSGRPQRLRANADFRMLSRADYFKSLAADVRRTKPGDRILLATTVVEPRPTLVAELLAALNQAAARGVQVQFFIDSYAFLISDKTRAPGPLWFSKTLGEPLRREFRDRLLVLKHLAENGGRYTITNPPGRGFTIPQRGRSHLKLALVNDVVYICGSNLNNPAEIDINLRWQDGAMADRLHKLMNKVARAETVRTSLHDKDQILKIDPRTRLFIDAGVPKQSVIFEQALQMIEDAREWIVFTSQYFPPGASTEALVRAVQRGVQVRYFLSHPSMHPAIESQFHKIAQWRARQRLPAELFAYRLPKGLHLHAKLLATEHGAMIGSHNYAQLGVDLGTAEIALKRDDPAFARQAVAFIENQLKQ